MTPFAGTTVGEWTSPADRVRLGATNSNALDALFDDLTLDFGAAPQATQPGSSPVDLEEECRRVLPVIAVLAKRSRARISVDTRKAEVMRRAAREGVHIINDVSALTHDPRSLHAVAELGLPVVLMHALGDPRTIDRKSTRLNSSHSRASRMPSSA